MTQLLDIRGSPEVGMRKLSFARGRMPLTRKLTLILTPLQPLLNTNAVLHGKGSSADGVVIESMLSLGVEYVDLLIEPDCADLDVVAALTTLHTERVKVHFLNQSQPNYRHLNLCNNDFFRFAVDEGGKFLAAIARSGIPRVDFGMIHTTRGLYEPKKHPNLGIPIVMVCKGVLKLIFDNYYGCGTDFIRVLHETAGLALAGCPLTVVGTGWVGRGILDLARAAGARVKFCEIDPLKALPSFVFHTADHITLDEAVKQNGMVIVLATGSNPLTVGNAVLTADVLRKVPAGVEIWVVVMGSGQELDLPGLCDISSDIFSETTWKSVTVQDALEFRLKGVTAFHLKGGGIVYLVGSGRRALNNELGGHGPSTMDPVLAYWLMVPFYYLVHPERFRVGPQPVPDEVERSLCSLVFYIRGITLPKLSAQQLDHYKIEFFEEFEEARKQHEGMW